MAPSATTNKSRENNFFDIGVQGRKTGITLKEGVRDENGLELIDGIFSSPERSTPKHRHGQNNTTISDEADMDLGQSTIPEPTEVLSQRSNARNSSNSILPPPRARSPIKTSLNSPARRHSSIGPISSPQRFSHGTPRDNFTAEPVNRRLDFSTMSRASADSAPSSASKPPSRPAPGRGRKLLSNIPAFQASSALKRSTIAFAEDEEDEGDEDEEQENEESVADDGEEEARLVMHVQPQDSAQEDESGYIHGQKDESTLLNGNDTTNDNGQEEDDDEEGAEPEPSVERDGSEEVDEEPDPPPKKSGRGRPSKKQKANPQPVSQPSQVSQSSQASAQKAHKKRGRPAKAKANLPREPTPEEPVAEEQAQEEPTDQPEEQAAESQEARPSKRGRKPKQAPVQKSSQQSPKESSNPTKSKGRKPPPSQRDPNARISSAKKPGASKSEVLHVEARNRAPSAQPAPRQIARHESPSHGDAVTTTRSGRTCIKPLAFWRNERVVYGQGEQNPGERHYLPAITEIIRTEEVAQPTNRRGKPRTKGPAKAGRKRKAREVEEEEETEDEGDEREDWEMGEGIISGGIKRWDSATGATLDEDEDEEVTELAYAHSAIETREVANTTFRYAKTLTLPFFGSGMVDLPPAGVKKMKNSRKMQMVFFVFHGHVQVKVANNVFGISKGGMWQVPRGNFYSIANLTTRPARIFFAQGCEVPLGHTQDLIDQHSQQSHMIPVLSAGEASMMEGESRLG
ncbi:hypothetical protein L228DRAFT_249500 [Xylona heveae TC161]|uniref:CENP-C homolog n=1 Tax=Xylona heveae (strain CBS 132557 / TC161) TaxID=1328760 RepID=A0A165F8N6_XYLHT|nr:hypothetical protein L228DRAFT_249500 [Xylona heveae TC161]KZF20708.1 hypothetical protein L228DRAFT_249500 [Xylona heveae TC161]